MGAFGGSRTRFSGRRVDALNLPRIDWPPHSRDGRRILFGLNDRDDAVRLRPGEFTSVRNVFFTPNALTRRYGYVRYTANPVTVTNGVPTKFFYFSPEGGTARWLIFANKTAYYLAGDAGAATATDTTGGFTANVNDCTQYNALLYAVTGNATDTIQQWDGTTWSAVTPNVSADNELSLSNGCKNCKYIIDAFDRLYVAGSSTNPQWVWISELADPTYYKTGSILKVDTKDGDAITGLYNYFGWIIIFKARSLHAIPYREPADTTFRRYLINDHRGAPNINTVKQYESILLFQGDDGHVYMLNTNKIIKEFMTVRRLSGKMSTTVATFSASDLSSAWAVVDDFKYKLFIANKCYVLDLLMSDLSSEETCNWTIWQFDEANQTVGEVNYSDKLLYTADATGRVNRFPTGTSQHTDAGTVIDWQATTGWFDLGRQELFKLFDRNFLYIRTTTVPQSITAKMALDLNTAISSTDVSTLGEGFVLGTGVLGTDLLGLSTELINSNLVPAGRGRRIQFQWLRKDDVDRVQIYGFTQYYELFGAL